MKAVAKALAVIVLAIASGEAACQESAPTLRLHVDGAADASVIQVEYMLAGPFGGYRTQVRGSAKQIHIPIAVRGQPAQSLKAIVFSPGYHTARIVIEDVAAAPTDLHVTLDPLPVRRLSGTVEFVGGAKPRSFILDIDVHVGSSHAFFGIMDGPLTKFDVA
ncbi:MAG TPA: hypothetical protein VJS12_24245, partial [Steroidobacteraceae bacterium]|nr:hypothetical protein [Steroidobacteraceae bacterium]